MLCGNQATFVVHEIKILFPQIIHERPAFDPEFPVIISLPVLATHNVDIFDTLLLDV